MRISGTMFGAAMLAALSMGAGSAQAQDGDAVGCWSAGTSPKASVCFGYGGDGLFLLVWNKGRCGGNAYVNSERGGRIAWEVPRQADACYQDGDPERLALREYSCRIDGRRMSCRETIYLDDGSIWKEKENVVFRAQ